MRRRTLALVLVTANLLCGGWFVWSELTPWSPGIDQASFERIRDGMSQQEVEAILGRPPEDRSHPEMHVVHGPPYYVIPREGTRRGTDMKPGSRAACRSACISVRTGRSRTSTLPTSATD
jgi:hypothetical protein